MGTCRVEKNHKVITSLFRKIGLKKENKELENVFQLINSVSKDELRNDKEGWLIVVCKLPMELYKVLKFELGEGNKLVDICGLDWPNVGNIVTTLKKPFNE